MTAAQYKTLVADVPALQFMFAQNLANTALLRPVSFEEDATAQDGQLDSGISKTNFKDGFPVEPFATKIGVGFAGKPVLIGDVNGMVREATKGLYLRQNGGTNEFDSRVVQNDVDSGSYGEDIGGYPEGAIIDWWDASDTNRYGTLGVFKKVVCTKSGGNCTVGPDDATHGVNGSGDKYWAVVITDPPSNLVLGPGFALSSADASDFVSYSNGQYTVLQPGLIRVYCYYETISTDYNTTNVNFEFGLFVKPGDKIKNNGGTNYSYMSVTFNSVTYRLDVSNFRTYSNKTVQMRFSTSLRGNKYITPES